ncbi:MAG: hypothetical protein GC158_14115 [Cyanobacteria bacterium RI_101]|jgi:hypothetical protein|nr:hypothetical protein [Cyanobacteria bacterium RI_101]
MESQPTWEMSATDNRPQLQTNWLSLLFFLMGAMNVYVFLHRQGNWLSQQGFKLLKIAAISATSAAALELLIF